MLNNIQQQIYDEYKESGRVWADCPRQCGKSALIGYILKEEIDRRENVNIFIKSVNTNMRVMLIERIQEYLCNKEHRTNATYRPINIKKHIVDTEAGANIIVYDELYFDLHANTRNIRPNIKIICLRTRPHEVMIFTHKDYKIGEFPFLTKERLKIYRNMMGDKEWSIEFNGGIINEHN